MYYKLKQSNDLYHYGIKGQKHGVRKYQNEDGSLTPEGKIHYGVGDGRKSKTTTIFNPGDKTSTKIKNTTKAIKDDFKNDVKSKKSSTKKVSRNTLFRPARSKTEKQARRNLAIAAAIVGSVAAISIGKTVIENYKDKKASEAKNKKYYNTVIDADDWLTINSIKVKDIGADSDYYNGDSYRYKSKY